MEKNASTVRSVKFTKNLFGDSLEELNFNVTLKFCYTNSLGTNIYQDPVNRYAFKTAECSTPFEEKPLVIYQGNLYIGKDGARYEVTRYPYQIDPYGVIQTEPNTTRRLSPSANASKENATTSPLNLKKDQN